MTTISYAPSARSASLAGSFERIGTVDTWNGGTISPLTRVSTRVVSHEDSAAGRSQRADALPCRESTLSQIIIGGLLGLTAVVGILMVDGSADDNPTLSPQHMVAVAAK